VALVGAVLGSGPPCGGVRPGEPRRPSGVLGGLGALSCEGAHQSGVAAQRLPMRGSKKVKNAKQAKVESTRK
jgi:hypothetical protein